MTEAYYSKSTIIPIDKTLNILGMKYSSWSKIEKPLLETMQKIDKERGEYGLSEKNQVVIMVKNFPTSVDIDQSIGAVAIYGSVVKIKEKEFMTLNGEEVTKDELKSIKNDLKEKDLKKEILYKKYRSIHLSKVIKTLKIKETPSIAKAIENGERSVSLSISYKDTISLLKTDDNIISSIGTVKKEVELSMGSAMIATEIDYCATVASSGARGNGSRIYYREYLYCPDPKYIDNNLYSTTSVPYIGKHGLLVGGILHTVSPEAEIICENSITRPLSNPFSTVAEDVTVENHSWAIGNEHPSYVGQNYSDIDKMFDNHVHDFRKSIFVASGNRNVSPNDYVTTPAKAFNVISVGNYMDTYSPYKMNDIDENTSSYINSTLGNEKPEISAPGTDIDYTYTYTESNPPLSEERTILLSGTSMASPHAAAFATSYISGTKNSSAFLRSVKSPSLLKSLMIASATNVIGDGVGRAGVGGVNFDIGYNHWQFMHSSYDPVGDYPFPENYPYNICVEIYDLPLNTSMGSIVRFSLAWLNRGDYIYTNATTGLELKLYVNAPNGWHYNVAGASNNSYDNLEFPLSQSGNHKIYVCRMRNDDPNVNIDIGLTVTTY